MVVIEEVTYKNFLASGAKPITIRFSDKTSTLITGSNGAGKSTLLDALNFVLFGKAFRNIKKGQLVNSINSKGMVVECKFSTNGRQYRVIRGMKPNIFEIYEDGQLIDQEAATKDYQKALETQILKLNYNTFNNVVILGSASYIPFMQLSAADRREVIEEILDIKIFSAMSEVLKTKMLATQTEITETKSRVDLLSSKLESSERLVEMKAQRVKDLRVTVENLESGLDGLLAERTKAKADSLADINAQLEKNAANRSRYVAEFDKIRDARVAQLASEESDLRRDLAEAEDELAGIIERLGSTNAELGGYGKSEAALALSRREYVKTSTKIEGIEEQSKFFVDNPSCPTCKQPIAEDHKHAVLEEQALDLTQKRTELESLAFAVEQLEREVESKEFLEKEATKLGAEKRLAEGNLKSLQTRLAAASKQKALEEAKTTSSTNYDDEERSLLARRMTLEAQVVTVDDLKEKIVAAELQVVSAKAGEETERAAHEKIVESLDALRVEYGDLLERRKIEDAAKVLLKDNGIKTAVIREYLPAINKLINQYLAAMDFFVSFELNESFDEVIKSRGRDEFSYASFSEGEKRRIDLAILFTWRQIAQMKNSVNVNLMILDEILDGSLDGVGIEHFMGIMSQFGQSSNIFVISHRDIVDGFDSYLRFEKRNDFSVLNES